MWDMTHSHVRHDSLKYETANGSDQFLVKCYICRETWLIHVWDMTHSHVRHDWFTCQTWLIKIWDSEWKWSTATHCNTLQHTFFVLRCICRETSLLHVWDMTSHTYACTHTHESCHLVVDTFCIPFYGWVMAHMWMSHGTHMNESWHTYEWIVSPSSRYILYSILWMSHGTHVNESCLIF